MHEKAVQGLMRFRRAMGAAVTMIGTRLQASERASEQATAAAAAASVLSYVHESIESPTLVHPLSNLGRSTAKNK